MFTQVKLRADVFSSSPTALLNLEEAKIEDSIDDWVSYHSELLHSLESKSLWTQRSTFRSRRDAIIHQQKESALSSSMALVSLRGFLADIILYQECFTIIYNHVWQFNLYDSMVMKRKKNSKAKYLIRKYFHETKIFSRLLSNKLNNVYANTNAASKEIKNLRSLHIIRFPRWTLMKI